MMGYEKRLDDLQRALAQLEQKRAELIAEIQELRAATEAANIPESGNGVFLHSPEADKIHLFRNLFAGRLHRLHDSKTEVRIYDYVDQGNPVLTRMFERRIKGYEAIGYSLPSGEMTLL